MDISKKSRRLLFAILLMSGSTILAGINILGHFIKISDFTKGFFEGMAITMSVLGMIALILYVVKYRKF